MIGEKFVDISVVGTVWAQAKLELLEHFAVDSAYEGLVAVDGLETLLCPKQLPRLRSLALSGLSLVPFSLVPCADHQRYLPRGCADRCVIFTAATAYTLFLP